MPATAHKTYATSRFQVKIDGHPITSFVKNVEGGLYKVESSTNPTGPYHIPLKHVTTRSVEPISLELGLSGTDWAIGLLERVINNRDFSRLEGEVLHVDANTKLRFRQEFHRALVSEITLPALDATSKESAFVKVKLQPETIDFESLDTPGAKIQPDKDTKQRLWGTNSFRMNLEINGTKINCDHVSKIEAITVKIGTKANQRGKFHLPEIIPTKLDFSKIGVTLPLDCAGDFINWYRNTVTKENGKADGSEYEATGSIEYLNQSRSQTLYSIDLMGVAPENFVITKTEASSSNHKSVKVDLYCTQIKVSKAGLVGA